MFCPMQSVLGTWISLRRLHPATVPTLYIHPAALCSGIAQNSTVLYSTEYSFDQREAFNTSPADPRGTIKPLLRRSSGRKRRL